MAKPPTAAQVAARERNWKIRQLRMLNAHVSHLSPSNAKVARALIDADLMALGADTIEQHRNRASEKLERLVRHLPLKEIPF